MEWIDPRIILIIQAMQLLVIALIVIITINSKTVSAITHESIPFILNLKLVIKSKNPLFFISLGFLFNWIYLFFNIFSKFETFIDKNTLDILINIFNILNTYCFLLQVLPNLTISTNEQSIANHSRSIKEVIWGWKGLSFAIITFFAIVIGLYNLQESRTGFGFSIFNLTGFLCISIYLYRLISIYHDTKQVDITRYVILAGCIIWTILQLLTPLGNLLLIPKDTTNLLGFSGSLLAKFLILYGLYVFINRYTSKQIEKKNSELEQKSREIEKALNEIKEKNKELLEKNKQLKKNEYQLEQKIAGINSLPDLINSVSNSKDLDELAKRTVEHLTNKEVFDFDYAIFSEVNYLKQIIKCKDFKKEHDDIEDIGKWVQDDGFPFDHHDIMAQVVKDAETVHAKGEKLNGELIDINSEKSPLNREIYIKYNHQYLNRFFIPLKNLKDDEAKDKVVAVIEIGYYIKNIDPQISTHKTKEKVEKLGELDLYLDDCAQTYERLFHQYVENEIDSLLKECDESSKDDHIKYFEEILESTRKLINAEFGFIRLLPVNKVFWNALSIVDNKEKSQLEDSLDQCVEQNGNSNDYIKISEDKFEQEVREFLDIKSMRVTDIYTQGFKLGYLFMFSKNKKHFNEIVNSILEKISANIGTTYSEKKFHNAVSSLITPDNAINDLETNLQPLIEALKNYFETPHISIWLRENKDRKEFYVQKYASKELKAGCETFNNKIPIDNITLEDDYEPIKLTSSDNDDKNSLFKGFGHRNNFKMLLRKPLKTQHQIFGFIHIYSNKNIDNLHYEDKKENKEFLNYEDKNFLDLVATKALITIQIHKLVNAFSEISASFTQNDLKETLKTITDSAVNLLNADPVILFKSNNGEDVFCNNVMFSCKDDFKEKEIIKLFEIEKDNHVEFAEQIIKDRSKYFKNKSEYQDYIIKHSRAHNKGHFEKDFWDREGIQSLAAVRLVHRTKNYEKPVGVMFINFRKRVNLDDLEIKGLIRTFADFAATAIHNAYLIEQNIAFLEMRRKDEFAMSIGEIATAHAHDSAQLLASMSFCFMSFLDSLEKKYKSSETIPKKIVEDKLLAPIKLPLEELTADFMRLENYRGFATFNAKPNKIIPLVNETITLLRYRIDKNSIDVEVKSMRDDATVYCDSNQILHLMMNIFINAIDAIGKKGLISVGTNITDKKDFLILRITDTGIGIPNENRDKIFKPFFTTKHNKGGTGVGLPICKYIIEKHDGSIEFEKNAAGKGTSFLIKFPIMKGEKND